MEIFLEDDIEKVIYYGNKKPIKIYKKYGDCEEFSLNYINHRSGFANAVNNFLELEDKYDEDQYKKEAKRMEK